MMIPARILDAFAAVMLLVAAVSCARLVAARPWSRPNAGSDIDAAHILMGIAMAGMLASGLRTLPNGVWAAVFAVVTAWFGWRVTTEVRERRASALSTGHHFPHLVHGAAMVYMFVALTSPALGAGSAMSGMSGAASSMGTLRLPTLGLAFVLFMAGWAVWDLDQLTSSGVQNQRYACATRLRARPESGMTLVTAGSALAVSGGSPAGFGAATALADSAVARPASEPPAASADEGGVSVPGGPLLDPQVAIGCRIAMGITMALMLVIMI
jgi:hypothetical protein